MPHLPHIDISDPRPTHHLQAPCWQRCLWAVVPHVRRSVMPWGHDVGPRPSGFRSVVRDAVRAPSQGVEEESSVSLTLSQLRDIKSTFDEATNGELDEDTFVDVLQGKVRSTEPRLRTWFRQIDANANGSVDWDEFSSFVLLDGQRQVQNSEVRKNAHYQVPPGHQAWTPNTSHSHSNTVTSVVVHSRGTGPSATRIFTGSSDGTVKVWSPTSLEHEVTINTPSWVLGSRLTRSGRRLITAHTERALCIIDTQRLDVTAILAHVTGGKSRLRFEHVGRVVQAGHGQTGFSAIKRLAKASRPTARMSPPGGSTVRERERLNGFGSSSGLEPRPPAGAPNGVSPAQLSMELEVELACARDKAISSSTKLVPNIHKVEGLVDVPFCIETIQPEGTALSQYWFPDGKGDGVQHSSGDAEKQAGPAASSLPQDEDTLLCVGLRNGDLLMYHLESDRFNHKQQLIEDVNANVLQVNHRWKSLHASCISGVRWANSIGNIITVGWDGAIRFLNAETCRVARVLEVASDNFGGPFTAYQEQSIFGFDWSGDLKMLGSFGAEHHISLWNPYISTPVMKLQHPTGICDVTFAPDNQQLLTLTDDKNVKIWDIRTFKCIQTVKQEQHLRHIRKIHYDKTLPGVVVCSHCPTVLAEVQPTANSNQGNLNLVGVVANPETASYMVTADRTNVTTWSTLTGDVIFKFALNEQAAEHFSGKKDWVITSIALDDNGRRLLTGTQCGKILLWNFINGQLLKVCDTKEDHSRHGDDPDVTCVLHCSRDNNSFRYIYGAVRGRLHVWHDSDGFHSPESDVWALPDALAGEAISTMSHDPPWDLAIGTTAGRVVLFNMKNSACSGSFRRVSGYYPSRASLAEGGAASYHGVPVPKEEPGVGPYRVSFICFVTSPWLPHAQQDDAGALGQSPEAGGPALQPLSPQATPRQSPRPSRCSNMSGSHFPPAPASGSSVGSPSPPATAATTTRPKWSTPGSTRLTVVCHSDGLIQVIYVKRKEVLCQWLVGPASLAAGSPIDGSPHHHPHPHSRARSKSPKKITAMAALGVTVYTGDEEGCVRVWRLAFDSGAQVTRQGKFTTNRGKVRYITEVGGGGRLLALGADTAVLLYTADGAFVGEFGALEKWSLRSISTPHGLPPAPSLGARREPVVLCSDPTGRDDPASAPPQGSPSQNPAGCSFITQGLALAGHAGAGSAFHPDPPSEGAAGGLRLPADPHRPPRLPAVPAAPPSATTVKRCLSPVPVRPNHLGPPRRWHLQKLVAVPPEGVDFATQYQVPEPSGVPFVDLASVVAPVLSHTLPQCVDGVCPEAQMLLKKLDPGSPQRGGLPGSGQRSASHSFPPLEGEVAVCGGGETAFGGTAGAGLQQSGGWPVSPSPPSLPPVTAGEVEGGVRRRCRGSGHSRSSRSKSTPSVAGGLGGAGAMRPIGGAKGGLLRRSRSTKGPKKGVPGGDWPEMLPISVACTVDVLPVPQRTGWVAHHRQQVAEAVAKQQDRRAVGCGGGGGGGGVAGHQSRAPLASPSDVSLLAPASPGVLRRGFVRPRRTL